MEFLNLHRDKILSFRILPAAKFTVNPAALNFAVLSFDGFKFCGVNPR